MTQIVCFFVWSSISIKTKRDGKISESVTMIEANNIHKYYNELHVLKGVNLHIAKSEIVSIVGASGAGKTTLLQILGTLDKPDAENGSSLIINGQDILQLKDKALSKFRNQQLGFIFSSTSCYPNLPRLKTYVYPPI